MKTCRHAQRTMNFYAGPSTLPLSVLEELAETIVDYHGSGLSLIETSHRSPMYDRVHNRAIDLVRELLGVPRSYHVLFLGGGATLQFSMVPMNLIPPGGGCDFVLSGTWAEKAMEDAEKIGNVRVVFDGRADGYVTLPRDVRTSEGSCYLHITSNETINGVQWKRFPATADVPVVADMSSDIMSRRFDAEAFGVIYAGAQKNLGAAGVTVVIIRDDLVESKRPGLTAYLRYATHAEKSSLYNTPPVFSVYTLCLVLEWVRSQGGVEEIERMNKKKSAAVYDAIDAGCGFYSSPVDRDVRSTMNVVFRLPTEEMERRFVAEAEAAGMIGLKGHRSVGGCRASLYNALPEEWADALADFMGDFLRRNG